MADNGWDEYKRVILERLDNLKEDIGERTGELKVDIKDLGKRIDSHQRETDEHLLRHEAAIVATKTEIRSRATFWAAIIASPPAIIALVALIWALAT